VIHQIISYGAVTTAKGILLFTHSMKILYTNVQSFNNRLALVHSIWIGIHMTTIATEKQKFVLNNPTKTKQIT